jgi:hypothetical protein
LNFSDFLVLRFPNLFLRDLDFSRTMSEILIRPNCRFLKLDHLRVLITNQNECLVFDDGSSLTCDFATRIRAELSGGTRLPLEQVVKDEYVLFFFFFFFWVFLCRI